MPPICGSVRITATPIKERVRLPLVRWALLSVKKFTMNGIRPATVKIVRETQARMISGLFMTNRSEIRDKIQSPAGN